MIMRAFPVVMMSIFLLGCSASDPVAKKEKAEEGPRKPAAERIALFNCGQVPVKVVYQGKDKLALHMGGNQYRLNAVPAASGAKYETVANASPRVMFWNKGGEAMLEHGHGAPLDCVQLGETSDATPIPKP